MRQRLKNERLAAKLKQKQIAELVGIKQRHYQHLEAGTREGRAYIWDALEALFGVDQKTLREVTEITKAV